MQVYFDLAKEYGYQVYFLMNKEAPAPSNPRIQVAHVEPKVGLYEINPMSTKKWLGHDEVDDALQTLQICKNEGISNVIADHYALGFEWSNLIITCDIKLIFINDLLDKNLNCTAVIDATFGRRTYHYNDIVEDSCELICGERYSILNANYLKFKNKPFVVNNTVNKILICFGGSDRNNLTEICADYLLQNFEDVEVVVIIGRINTRINELKSKFMKNPHVTFLHDVPDMWNWYSMSDICIGAGGTMCAERAYIGIPSIIITTAENQFGNARYLHSKNAASYVGHWEDGSLMENFDVNLKSLFSRENRLLLSMNGRRLVGKNPTQQLIGKINGIFA